MQRGVLIARVIETANHFWSLINSNLKVDESMITLEQDLETGDVESGDIRCLMCSRYTKLNITKKKNTRDCTNYISLSNYKIHVMKTHLTLDQKTVLKEQLKSCLELERRQEIKTLALNQKPNSPNVEPKQEHLEISRIEPESSSFGSIQFIKMEFDAEETTEELSSLATRQKPSLVKKNKSK